MTVSQTLLSSLLLLLVILRNTFNGSLCLNNAELQALLLNLVWHLAADWLICIPPIIPSFCRSRSTVDRLVAVIFIFLLL